MGSLSIWHWLIVLAVVLIVFGRGGRISDMMGDFGKGIKSFKKGLSDEDSPARLHEAAPPSTTPAAPLADPVPPAYDNRPR